MSSATRKVTIENLLGKPIWLRLNSGVALSVMPGSIREVPVGEVLGNAKLKQLHDRRMIRTEPPYGDAESAAAEPAKKKAGAARREGTAAARADDPR
jgi:hypothetical protein